MARTHINQPPTHFARPEMNCEITGQTGFNRAMLITRAHKFYDRLRADSGLTQIFVDHITDWPAITAADLVERAARITRSSCMAVENYRPSKTH